MPVHHGHVEPQPRAGTVAGGILLASVEFMGNIGRVVGIKNSRLAACVPNSGAQYPKTEIRRQDTYFPLVNSRQSSSSSVIGMLSTYIHPHRPQFLSLAGPSTILRIGLVMAREGRCGLQPVHNPAAEYFSNL
jgi:hypothetical protein